MQTKELPEQITKLKADLKRRVEQFNKETELYVSGVIIEGVYTQNQIDDDTPIVKGYRVGVNIEL